MAEAIIMACFPEDVRAEIRRNFPSATGLIVGRPQATAPAGGVTAVSTPHKYRGVQYTVFIGEGGMWIRAVSFGEKQICEWLRIVGHTTQQFTAEA